MPSLIPELLKQCSESSEKKKSEPQGNRFSVIIRPTPDAVANLFYVEEQLKEDAKASRLGKPCQFFDSFCMVLHDRDVDGEGAPVTPHLHIVGYTYGRHTKSKVLHAFQRFCFICGINPQGVSVEILKNPVGMLRYLIHLDSEDKTRYEPSDVYSSTCMAQEEFTSALHTEPYLTVSQLAAIVTSSKTLTEVAFRLGMTQYMRYRVVIKDLWTDRFLFQQNDFSDDLS